MLQVAHSTCDASPIATCQTPRAAAGHTGAAATDPWWQRAKARWTAHAAARRERARHLAVQRAVAGLDARTLRDLGLGDGLRSWQESRWIGWDR